MPVSLRQILVLPILCLSVGMGPVALAQSTQRPTLQTFDQIVARMPAVTELNLTPEQQTQLIQIMNRAQVEAEAIMTDPQKYQFWSALNQGQQIRDALMGAGLSLTQMWQLRPMMQSTQSQLRAVLTPEQQQQVEAYRQANP